MAVGKEIRDQIKSVSSTQKITSAMEMVAASKMRKAQERMQSSRPYSDKISYVVGHMAQSNSEYKHAYLQERPVKNVGVIIISSDRGLCGGLNINLFRTLLAKLQEFEQQNITVDFSSIGSKSRLFLASLGKKPLAEVSEIGDQPLLHDIIGSIKVMLNSFNEGKIDQLLVIYNKFINGMTQQPTIKQLLPLTSEDYEEDSLDADGLSHYWDYIYEPDAKEVMDKLLMRYIESIVYQGVVENIACEQSARMVAMKNATDNAGDLIDGLQLIYNKARQTAITAELADIVGGAAAVS